MTEAQRRDDYERSCLLATRVMRERLIRTGQILPRPDDPEEREWHEQWKSKQTKGVWNGSQTQISREDSHDIFGLGVHRPPRNGRPCGSVGSPRASGQEARSPGAASGDTRRGHAVTDRAAYE